MTVDKRSRSANGGASVFSAAARTAWLPTVLGAGVVVLIAAGVVFTQTQTPADTQAILKELQAIKQAQAAIQKELAELKAIIQGRPAAPAAPQAAARPGNLGRMVSIAGAPFKGRPDAPLTLVEFSDFQCPFCARHFTQSMPQIVNEYIDNGKLKYVFRHFPLENIHPLAFKAAEAAECANDQQKFWPMHDRLFSNPTMLGPQHLPAHATALGLESTSFQQCLSSGKHAPKIRKDLADGAAAGVTGTPAFVLGRTVLGSPSVRVDAFISGARPYASFKQELDQLLSRGSQ